MMTEESKNMSIVIDPEFRDLIPPLIEEDRKNLEESLVKEGCRDALVVWNGVLVDGHNRYEICIERGIPFKTVEKEFSSRNEAMLWMIDNQLSRRNVNTADRILLAQRKKPILEEMARGNLKTNTMKPRVSLENKSAFIQSDKASLASESDRPKQGKTSQSETDAFLAELFGTDMPEDKPADNSEVINESEDDPEDILDRLFADDEEEKATVPSVSQADRILKAVEKKTVHVQDEIAKLANVGKGTVARFEQVQKKRPDLVEDIRNRKVSIDGAYKQIKADEKKQNKEEKARRKSFTLEETIPDGYCQLFCDDIRNGLINIADNSVDFIITDPPYPKEYIPLYSDLSKVAARVLKPGGSLIVMVGQSYFPEVMQRLSEEMTYHWCMAYTTPGGQSPQLFHKKVNTFWKPVLWFTNGEYKGDWIGDVLKSPVNANDKRFHEWGQSLGGMMDIVERFTDPGDTILDPFLGGGTTGVAAVTMKRRFIGYDIEQKNVDISNKRITEEYAECLK